MRTEAGSRMTEHVTGDFMSLTSENALRAAGAGYRFCQNGMNFIQQATGLHAPRKQGAMSTFQAGAFYQGADFKIESIV